MGVCMLTAAFLYVDPLSTLVGRRDLVATLPFAAGLALPAPLLVGVIASAAFRRDASGVNRFSPPHW